jgi:carboxyvinyl-carboxyphosphonate phosphorylmutase
MRRDDRGGEDMHWTERRERFRAILTGERCVYPGSVWDPISARIAEDLGFEVGMFAGSVASMTVLGAPDLIVLTLSEFAEQAYRICRAGNLALLVDADHGYGNALNVKRTVEELETAGVAALSIEDTVLPRAFGAGDKAQFISIEEGVGKMKGALAGRQDPRLVIAGRTSAISSTGLDDAIARGRAYEAAGVDALFFVGLRSRAELDAIAEAVKLPLIIGSAAPAMMDLDYLSARRVRVCLQGHQPFAASVRAAYETLKALREGTPPAKLQGVAAADLMKQVTRDADFARWVRDFL